MIFFERPILPFFYRQRLSPRETPGYLTRGHRAVVAGGTATISGVRCGRDGSFQGGFWS
ncbi:MAG: hypothetical protein PWQ69_1141 [Methanomicrobiaceae archaeon]|nr:hypothetical protein [Methanomicrobiaceae archaeon]